jgi:hypothetical protein
MANSARAWLTDLIAPSSRPPAAPPALPGCAPSWACRHGITAGHNTVSLLMRLPG